MLSAKAVNRWADDWADRLNPIVVKETRQVFKARMVTISFLLLLLISWFVSLSFVMAPAHPQAIRGPDLFVQLIVVLAFFLFYVTPYVAFRSMAAERDKHTFEMLSVSALTNQQIFWGKVHSSLILIGLFEAAFAPFLSMTYLLKGLSVIDIAVGLIFVTVGAFTLTLLALMLGAAAKQSYLQVLNLFFVLAASTFAMFVTVGAMEAMGEPRIALEGFCCMTAFCVFPNLLFASVALSSLRPQTLGMVRTYMGLEDLPAVTAASEEFSIVLKRHFTIQREPGLFGRAKNIILSQEATREILSAAIALERILNPRRRQFGHLGRYRYLTIKGAAEPLETICSAQNIVLHRFGWVDACLLEEEAISLPETFAIEPLTPELLETLSKSVKQLQTLLKSDPLVETEEAGNFSNRDQGPRSHRSPEAL